MTSDADAGAKVRIILVDDQELVRAGFRMVLDAQPDLDVVGEAGDGGEALRLIDTVRSDVVLMDIRMPGMDGVEATRRICAAGAGAVVADASRDGVPRVLILTTFDLDEYAYAALKAGASGFMLKDAPPPDLLSAIRAVHSGDAVVAPSTTRRLLDRFAGQLPVADEEPAAEAAEALTMLSTLTPREREVLTLVARGLSNTEIAASIYVSEATVKTHVGRILTKLDLRDRVQAVVLAYETGLVDARG